MPESTRLCSFSVVVYVIDNAFEYPLHASVIFVNGTPEETKGKLTPVFRDACHIQHVMRLQISDCGTLKLLRQRLHSVKWRRRWCCRR